MSIGVFKSGESWKPSWCSRVRKGKTLSSLTGACNSGVAASLDSTLILASYAVQQIEAWRACKRSKLWIRGFTKCQGAVSHS